MSDESQSIQIPSKPDITEIIIYALRQEYEPVLGWNSEIQNSKSEIENPKFEIEFKTTIDLMEEINSFGTADRETVTRAMLSHGFTIRTIEGKPYWILRKK